MSRRSRPDMLIVGRRVAARAVDAFTVFFVTFGLAVSVLFAVMAPLTDALDLGPWGRALAPTLVFVLLAVTYETVFVALRGQTPGKDLLNVKVTRDGTSAPLWVTAFVRAVVAWSVVVVAVVDLRVGLAIVAAGVLALVIDPGRMGVLDRLCGTTVISYDADLEEGPIDVRGSSDDLESRYGPRLWRSLTGVAKP